MKQQSKQFHLGDILSVTHDKLVSPRHIDGVYEVMQHLFGQPIWTHQLVVLHDEAKRELLRQHPQLVEISSAEVNQDNWRRWLDQMVSKYGEQLYVSPIVNAEQRDPLNDLEGMVGKAKLFR